MLIRCLGGEVAWSFVGGSLPGIGGVWRWMATAELFRWTGLLGHSKIAPRVHGDFSMYYRVSGQSCDCRPGQMGARRWLGFWKGHRPDQLVSTLGKCLIDEHSRRRALRHECCRVLARMLELQAVQAE